MGILAMALVVLGGIVSLIGGIWFLIASFRESIWWGLGCLFIAPVQLFFLIFHWDVAGKPFGVSLLGSVLCIAAFFIAPESFQSYLG